jgi:hypothetical protein
MADERGDNLLISNFDRYATEGNEFIAVVYITERDRYTAIPGGYHERVIVQGDRDALRQAVREAFDYARRAGILRVQVNNAHVLDDLEAGILDAGDLEIVDPGGVRPAGMAGLIAALRAHRVPEKRVQDLIQQDDLRCGICGRTLEISDSDSETVYLSCPTGEDEHTDYRIDLPASEEPDRSA